MLNKYLTSVNDYKIIVDQYVTIVEWIDPEGEGIFTNFSVLNMNCYFHEWEDRLFILLYIVIYSFLNSAFTSHSLAFRFILWI